MFFEAITCSEDTLTGQDVFSQQVTSLNFKFQTETLQSKNYISATACFRVMGHGGDYRTSGQTCILIVGNTKNSDWCVCGNTKNRRLCQLNATRIFRSAGCTAVNTTIYEEQGWELYSQATMLPRADVAWVVACLSDNLNILSSSAALLLCCRCSSSLQPRT